MIIIAIFMYPPLLSMPHSTSYILKLAVLIFLYVIFVILATKVITPQSILRIGTLFGAIAAMTEIIHISIENFGHLNARAETVSTGIFMVAIFLLFAASGYCVNLNKKNIISGLWTGLWSAVVCMLLVMTYGLSQHQNITPQIVGNLEL